MPKRPKTRLGLGDRHARLEARHQREPKGIMSVQVVARRYPWHGNLDHAHGDEHSRLVAADGGVEVLRSDAENSEGVAVDEHNLAHHIARRSEAGLPIVV